MQTETEQQQNLTPDEARQGERVGLIWILTAGTLVAVMGLGAIALIQAV